MQTLSRLALNDGGFAFDPATGDSYLVNQSGVAILHGLQDEQSEGQLAQTLAQRFGISLESAVRDVSDFVTRLKSIRLM